MTRPRNDWAVFQLDRLRLELKPFKLHWFPTVGSTNTHAAKMRREGRLLAPAIMLTGRQSAGRGRGVNRWHSPAGVMTATFVLPAHETIPPQHVPLIAGLAVRDAVASFGVEGVGIKWPNDLWVDDLKLAGLLCERIGSIDLIGVGLNVNVDLRDLPATIGKKSVSLRSLIGQPIDLSGVLIETARRLHAELTDARTSLARLLPRLRSADVLKGRRIVVSDPSTGSIRGICDGIDSDGRIAIRSGGKRHLLFTGTVSLDGAADR